MSKKEKTEVDTSEKKKPIRKSRYAGKGRAITVPIVKLNVGDEVAYEFSGESRSQKIGADSFKTDPKTGEQVKIEKEPATLYRATDLDTGEVVDVIAPMVLVSTLERNYPDGFAGKKLVLKIGKRPDKKYNDVLVSELEE